MSTIRACDDALNEFSRLCDRVAEELTALRAEIADYDDIMQRRARAISQGTAFVYEAAAALKEVREGKTLLELMRPDAARRDIVLVDADRFKASLVEQVGAEWAAKLLGDTRPEVVLTRSGDIETRIDDKPLDEISGFRRVQ